MREYSSSNKYKLILSNKEEKTMKLINFVKEKANAVKAMVSGAMVTAMTLPVCAGYQVGDNLDPTKMLNDLLNLVIGLVTGVGIIIAVWGAAQFGFGIKDGEADSMKRGLFTFLGGVVVAALPAVLKGLGVLK